MKHVAIAMLLGSFSLKGLAQQTDSIIIKKIDTIKVGGMTIIKSMGDNRKEIFIADTSIRKSDTIKFGTITIIGKDIGKKVDELTKKVEDIDLSKLGELKDRLLKKKPKKVSTNWFVFDIGYAGYTDKTDYSSFDARAFMASPLNEPPTSNDFALRTSRVSNFNLWFFIQRLSLIKSTVNLKYGFGIESNNYFFKTGITYVDDGMPTAAIISPVYTKRKDPGSVSKNKLVANYFTVPMMININTNPMKAKSAFQVSFGVSGGYLFGAWQKQRTTNGKDKTKSEFNLEPFKLSYIGELGLGKVKLYGSVASGKMHQYGVNQVPYTVGVRFSN
ncbi:MAG: outer membrane beta-barrel protein [Chitinophagia bacterium]|jgi:hypothetical protein